MKNVDKYISDRVLAIISRKYILDERDTMKKKG